MFLSALDEVHDKAKGFEVGGTDYVTKPFNMIEVQARVKSLLKAKAYNDSIKERIASELRIAREIQMGMVPSEFTALEESFGVALHGLLRPAREVGGDLYAAFAVPGDRLCLVMGDVSGKGIPASLFMVRAATLVRTLARQTSEPDRILAALNDELVVENPSGMFVTLVCAVYDPATRRVTLANGGQTQPVVIRRGQAAVRAVHELGTALGLEPGISFESVSLELLPGDALVFCTDGVIEAFNAREELYGSERMLKSLSGAEWASPEELNRELLADVERFAEDAPQSDDVALLSLLVTPVGNDGQETDAHGLRMELKATPEQVMQGCDALRAFGEAQGLEENTLYALTLAFEEAGSNIVQHAYGRDAERRFEFSVQRTKEQVVVEIRDCGEPFNPLSAKPAEIDVHPDDRDIGGLGIHLMQKMMDELSYERRGDENVLKMVKRLA